MVEKLLLTPNEGISYLAPIELKFQSCPISVISSFLILAGSPCKTFKFTNVLKRTDSMRSA